MNWKRGATILLLAGLAGCANPYINPVVAKAVEEEKQTALMERQTKALEKIADAVSAPSLSADANSLPICHFNMDNKPCCKEGTLSWSATTHSGWGSECKEVAR